MFAAHQGRYGYRRITLELQNRGYVINHKTVHTLMEKLGLKSLVRIKNIALTKGKRENSHQIF
ncbi:hypothetical protein CN553_31265 [Bacillus cereus]|uniref:HTH-like domain-containing protein n=1 Tax=Bacillus cereus TaxID=1396 RepID=A0A9X6YJC9_BACCE|nr:hypothetical protein CN553_31265 [Bacillus cereus]